MASKSTIRFLKQKNDLLFEHLKSKEELGVVYAYSPQELTQMKEEFANKNIIIVRQFYE